MRVEWNGREFRLEFSRSATPGTGVLTTVRLMEGLNVAARATARQWHSRSGKTVDPFSREDGRQAALRRMVDSPLWNVGGTPEGNRELRGLVLQAYFNRPHTPDVAALRHQREVLDGMILRLEQGLM